MYAARSTVRLVTVLLATGLLAACNDAPPPVAPATKPSPAAAPAAPAVPGQLNSPLSADQVNVTLSLDGQPRYLSTEDALLVNVKIANNGQVELVGAGTYPVNLAALLLGPEGPDKAPGLRDFVRVPLPVIAKGTQSVVQVKLPAESLKGQKVQFQLVQEGVAWFNGFDQAPLDLGRYSRCNSGAKALCDGSDTPVAE